MYGCNGTNARNVYFTAECPYCAKENDKEWEMCCEESTDSQISRCEGCAKVFVWRGEKGSPVANTDSVEEYYGVESQEEFVAEYGSAWMEKNLI